MEGVTLGCSLLVGQRPLRTAAEPTPKLKTLSMRLSTEWLEEFVTRPCHFKSGSLARLYGAVSQGTSVIRLEGGGHLRMNYGLLISNL
jgi:hypothetical protein